MGWELMYAKDKINDWGLPGHCILYHSNYSTAHIRGDANMKVFDTKAAAAFTRDCWEIYRSKNAFQVDRRDYLPSLLRLKSGGGGVMKRQLENAWITINIFEVKGLEGHRQLGKAEERLVELLECANLEQVIIELESDDEGYNEGENNPMMQVLKEEVEPVSKGLRKRVSYLQVKMLTLED